MISVEEIQNFPKLCEEKMNKSIEVLKNNLIGVRTGRASPNILNCVQIEIYDNKSPLSHHSNISVLDNGRMLQVEPWDKNQNTLSNIKKAIEKAGLGLNPIVKGDCIQIPIPALTQERRTQLVTITKKHKTTAKDSINNIRSSYMSLVKKPNKVDHISDDEKKKIANKIQEVTDKYMKTVKDLTEAKEQEIMQ